MIINISMRMLQHLKLCVMHDLILTTLLTRAIFKVNNHSESFPFALSNSRNKKQSLQMTIYIALCLFMHLMTINARISITVMYKDPKDESTRIGIAITGIDGATEHIKKAIVHSVARFQQNHLSYVRVKKNANEYLKLSKEDSPLSWQIFYEDKFWLKTNIGGDKPGFMRLSVMF